MSLSPDQERAIDYLERFIESPRKRYAVLHGLAGTGKTYLMAQLAKRHPEAILATYTGKAADVLRRRVDVPVSTTYSLIYDFTGLSQDEEDPDKKNPMFVPKGVDLSDSVILLDECSMIGRDHAEVILRTGARIIACGDPGQLRPVRDAQFFIDPDVFLTEIHRQALESPIIRQAHNIRNRGRYEPDGPYFQVKRRAERDDLMDADMLLCWRNKTRLALNYRRREYAGLADKPLKAGEPVMCLKNDREYGIFNGAIYDLVEDTDPRKPSILIDVDNEIIEIEIATIEGISPNFNKDRYEDYVSPFAIGYACTAHKSQGSEWGSILVVDECRTEEWKSLMYTSVTRAVEKCTVIG